MKKQVNTKAGEVMEKIILDCMFSLKKLLCYIMVILFRNKLNTATSVVKSS